MPRHSKNANIRTFNSYYEKKRTAVSNQALIYGSDSVKPFDYCSLCLHHVSYPMCCDEGHLFCKECVLKYLLTKKKEYEERLRDYEVAMYEQEQLELEQSQSRESAICSSIEQQQSVQGSENKHMYVASNESKEEKELKKMKKIVDKLSCKYDDRTDEEKSLKRIFWLPENTPEFKEAVQKPSKTIVCPSGDHEISMKKLHELHFIETEEDKFSCPACMRPFIHQQVIAMKECGHVLCGECFKKFVASSKQCYVCQKPILKKKDFVQLESGGTGFSSHNKVDVKVQKPTENCVCLFLPLFTLISIILFKNKRESSIPQRSGNGETLVCCQFEFVSSFSFYGIAILVLKRMPPMPSVNLPDENQEDLSDGGLIRTCHLCGKAQCGQRRGRVRCAYCKRVFCLQQLYKKFKIRTEANDTNFKCPRCLGICCCVTNCQKPPPHVHCKVYKVRQTKRRNRELAHRENKVSRLLESTQEDPVQEMDRSSVRSISFFPPEVSLPPQLVDNYNVQYSDVVANQSYYYSGDIPGIQHSDWLTQLNLKMLDGGDNTVLNSGNSSISWRRKEQESSGRELFVDKLRYFINNRATMSADEICSIQDQLIADADVLQSRAEKSDMVFRMVDSFNRNTIHATVTWNLNNNSLNHHNDTHAIPALFTIVNCCPTVLFSLETSTSYGERDSTSSISITFFNTSTLKDVRALCTCIDLMNGTFQHYADVNTVEVWTEEGVSWKQREHIDGKLLSSMIAYGKKAQTMIDNSPSRCRIVLSYSRSSEDHTFENLPIISLVLKKVSKNYPSVVYVLERMVCDEHKVVCVLLFSEDRNWVKIINGYESNLEVCREENSMMMNRMNAQSVLLDL